MEEFKPGDVVYLKSGGVAMTVEREFKNMQLEDCVSCAWYEIGYGIRRDSFLIVMLKK